MIKLTPKDYKETIETCYNVKSPLYVYGGPGIGKSEIPRQIFAEIAEKSKKEYHEWTDLTLEEKMNAIQNPDKYFIFCDQRVAQMDTTDLRGIPNLVNTEMLETIPMSWVIYFTQPEAHGVIFFDELNLAAPVVAGSAYQIINERTIADRRLGPDVWVFGAGNRASIDKAHVFDMPFPLRDRFNEMELVPNREDWVDWAAGNVNPHLVAFINWKESYLYKVIDDSSQKSSTPRGIVRASKLIGDMKITTDVVHRYVSMAVGESFATEFQAYCKYFDRLDFEKIYANPECIEDEDKYDSSMLWAVIGGIGEQFLKGVSQERFAQMMQVIDHLKADFAIVCMRILKDSNAEKFGKQLQKTPDWKKIANRFGKFIMNTGAEEQEIWRARHLQRCKLDKNRNGLTAPLPLKFRLTFSIKCTNI